VCEAVDAHSRFEGEGAPAMIRQAIETALAAWTFPALPDAIVVIRGGGAVNDLAWLNDYELARAICLSPIPVLTGIGHERDSTILDEVAHQRFDTPSKVVAGIQALIVKRAREAQAAYEEVVGLAERRLRLGRHDVDALGAVVQRRSLEALAAARIDVQHQLAAVQRGSQRRLHEAASGSLQALGNVRAGAMAQLSTARARAAALAVDVQRHVVAAGAMRRKSTEDLLSEIQRLARSTLRWGADAADAMFREVVAQGPERTLARGFAVVHSPTGQVITRAAAAERERNLRLQFQDGTIEAAVRLNKEKP
jgi:exodeoxyribonuclease VII large subunit